MYPTFHRSEHTKNARRASFRMIAATMAIAGLHALFLTPTARAQNFGDWTTAVSIDPGRVNLVNSFRNDGCPHEAPDAGTLFFASDRDPNAAPDAPAKDLDVWVAYWHAERDEWSDAEPLPSPVNTGAMEFCPTPLLGTGSCSSAHARAHAAQIRTSTTRNWSCIPSPRGCRRCCFRVA
jgi:hypothetical protein